MDIANSMSIEQSRLEKWIGIDVFNYLKEVALTKVDKLKTLN